MRNKIMLTLMVLLLVCVVALTACSTQPVYSNAFASLGGTVTYADNSLNGLVGDVSFNISVENDATYPWAKQTDADGNDVLHDGNAVFMSGNKGVDSSTSAITLTFTSGSAGDMEFDYKISSEMYNDYILVTHNGTELNDFFDANTCGEINWTTYSTPIVSGENTLTIAYVKGGLDSSGDDTLYVSNIRATLPEAGADIDHTFDELVSDLPFDVIVTNDATCPLSKQTADGADVLHDGNAVFMSSNQAQNSSMSTLTFTFDSDVERFVIFDYKLSSEASRDHILVTCNGVELNDKGDTNMSGEVDWTTYMVPIERGENTIAIAYVKGSVGSSGDDTLYISNMHLGSPFEGEGTETSPYQLSNSDDLFNLANLVNKGITFVNKHLVLTSDIDLNDKKWTPIGLDDEEDSKWFSGVLNGQNHTISNLYMSASEVSYYGFISNAQNAVIENIVFDDVYMKGFIQASGIVCGYANGTTFDNITVTNANDVEFQWCNGGIVGYMQYDSYMTNCHVINSTLVVQNWVFGGLVAIVEDSEIVNSSVTNTTINSYPETWDSRVGGIAGAADDSLISGCTFDGIIVARNNYVGGILGITADGYCSDVTISNCVAKGDITGVTHVGGIIGGELDDNATRWTIENCINLADITATNSNAGGIIGSLASGYPNEVTINRCANAGAVSAPINKNEILGYGDATITYEDNLAVTSVGEYSVDSIRTTAVGSVVIRRDMEVVSTSALDICFANAFTGEIYKDGVLLQLGADYTVDGNTLTIHDLPATGEHKYVIITSVAEADTATRGVMVINVAPYADMPSVELSFDGNNIDINLNNRYSTINYQDGTPTEYMLQLGNATSGTTVEVSLSNGVDASAYLVGGNYVFKGFTDNVTVTITASKLGMVDKTLTFTVIYNEFSSGLGTAASPYIITLPEQFKHVKSDTYYTLGSDIDFSGVTEWFNGTVVTSDSETIKTYNEVGRFTLDGAGYSIVNFAPNNDDATLLGYIYGTVTIKNLNIVNAVHTADNADISFLCNTITDTAGHETDIMFESVHISGKVTGAKQFGAFVCNVFGTKVTFSNCSVNVDIVGSDNSFAIGGFIGAVNDLALDEVAKKVYFANCTFEGSLSNAMNIGGFIGEVNRNTVKVIDSISNGVIENFSMYAGGFLGYIGWEGEYFITNNTNYTDITATGDQCYGGAFIGYNDDCEGEFDGNVNAGILQGGTCGLIGNIGLFIPEDYVNNPVIAMTPDVDIVDIPDSYGNVVKYAKYSAEDQLVTFSFTLFEAGSFDLFIGTQLAVLGEDYTVSQDGLTVTVNIDGATRVYAVFYNDNAELTLEPSVVVFDLQLKCISPDYAISGAADDIAVEDGQQYGAVDGQYSLVYDMADNANMVVVLVNGVEVTPTVKETVYTYAFDIANDAKDFVVTCTSGHGDYLDSVTKFSVGTAYNVNVASNNESVGGYYASHTGVVMAGRELQLEADIYNSDYIFVGWYNNYGQDDEQLLSLESAYSMPVDANYNITAVYGHLATMPILVLNGGSANNVSVNEDTRIVQEIGTTATYIINVANIADDITLTATVGSNVYNVVDNKITISDISSNTVIELRAASSIADTKDNVICININMLRIFPSHMCEDDSIQQDQISNNSSYPFIHDDTITGRVAYRSTHNTNGNYGIEVEFKQSGIFTFDYKVASPDKYYSINIYLNNNKLDEYYGDIDWTEYSIVIPEGASTVKITYERSFAYKDIDDCIWVSNMSFVTLLTSGDTGEPSTAPLVLDNLASMLSRVPQGLMLTVYNDGMFGTQHINFGTAIAGMTCSSSNVAIDANGLVTFTGLNQADNVFVFESADKNFTFTINNAGLPGYDGLTGSGTVNNPYVITDLLVGINALQDFMDKHFMLGDTLEADANGVYIVDQENKIVTINVPSWSPIGSSASPFTGGFDGNGWTFVISNIADAANRGLFGVIDDAIISNLTVDISLDNLSCYGSTLGGIVGSAQGNSLIENCHVVANFNAKAKNMGGLVGATTESTTFTNCTVRGSITANTNDNVGGLTGNGGAFESCMMYADVTGNMLVGGLVGGWKIKAKFVNTYMAGTVKTTGNHGNNYAYFAQINGYGAWVSFDMINAGVQLTITYNNANEVRAVDIFNGEHTPILVSSVNNADGTVTKVYHVNLTTVYASMDLNSETKVNGVTGNYGGFVIRFSMNDGTYKYYSTLDRANAKFCTNMSLDLDELTSYVDNFSTMTIDTSIGTKPQSSVSGVKIFGTVLVDNANDFEHLQWIINGGIPTTFAGGNNYNARSVATISIKLTNDIDLTADRMHNGEVLNRVGGLATGELIHSFYGFGTSEMHPYRGSLYGNDHSLNVYINAPNGYLTGIIAMSSDLDNAITVSNLTITGTIIGGYRVGVVAMFDTYMRSSSILFDNVANYAEISGTAHAGGLLGVVHSAGSSLPRPIVTIRNCTVAGTVTGSKSGAMVGSSGNWSKKAYVEYQGINKDYTLMPYHGDYSVILVADGSDSTIQRTIKLHYGTGNDEYVELFTTDVNADSITIDSITIDGVTLDIGEQTFVFDNGGNYTTDFYIFILKGTISKDYDGNTEFGLGQSNYYGEWNVAGTVDSANANYTQDGYVVDSYDFDLAQNVVVVSNDLKLMVNKKAVTATFDTDELTYNGAAQSYGYTVSGFVEADYSSMLVENYLSSHTNVGDHTLRVTLSDDASNYTMALAEVTFTINAKELNVTLPSGYATTKKYGEVNPTWADILVDGVNGEQVTVTFARGASDEVGNYQDDITASITDANYQLVFTPVDFVITKGDITAELNATTFVYNESPIMLTSKVVGAGEVQPVGAVSYKYYAQSGAELTNVPVNFGVYDVKIIVAADSNYNTFESGLISITVNKATPVVSANPTVTKIYVGQSLTASNIVGGTVMGVDGNLEGVFTWVDGTTCPTTTGNYEVLFTPTNDNYNAVTISDVNVEVVQLTVTFKIIGVDDAITKEVRNVDYGDDIATENFPTIPTVEHYTNSWDASAVTNVVANVTVTATYTAVQYDITYNLDGGALAVSPVANYTIESDDITLQEPAKNGYTFGGWYSNEALTQLITTISSGSAGNKTIYAKWEVVTYDIEYVLNGGTNEGINPITYNIESQLINLANPSKTGYTFDGWNNGGAIASGSTGDKTFTASWKANSYTLSFDLGYEGGVDPADIDVTYDSAIGTLHVVSRTGYKFDGWYIDDAKLEATTVWQIDADKQAVGKWTANSYTLSWDAVYAGSSSFDDTTVTYDSEIGQLPTVTRTGYAFSGWYVGSDKLEATTEWKYTANQGAVAHWTANEYTLTLNGNGGTDSTLKVTFDKVYNLSNPTREGYIFIGWTNGTESFDPQGMWQIPSDVTLTANWIAKQYTLTFDLNNGVGVANAYQVTFDSAIGELPIVTRTGYLFADWYIGEDVITAETVWKYADAQLQTATAQWTAIKYDVVFDANTGNGSMDNQQFTYDEAQNLTANEFSKVGYTFAGWNSNANGTGTAYADNAEVENLTAVNEGSVTMFAQWTANTYALSFDLNGGTGTAEEITATYDAQIGELPIVTRTGYLFAGWYIGETKLAETTVWNYTTVKTATAQWIAIKYDVVFDANTGNGSMDNQQFTYDEAQNLTANEFSKVGYTLAGWNSKANGTGTAYADNAEVESLTAVNEGSVTMFAQWTANTYKLSFNLNGGTGTAKEITVTYDSEVGDLPTVERTGYTFNGWMIDGEGITSNSKWDYVEDQQASANWTAKGDTAYTVIHKQQAVEGDGFEVVLTENKTGATASEVTPLVNSYTGFVSPEAKTVEINADGSTTVVYLYMRTLHEVTFVVGDNGTTTGVTEIANVRYGATVTIPMVTANAGYTFDGWNAEVVEVTADVTYTAQYTAITYNISYQLNGGVNDDANPGTYTVESDDIKLLAPSKEHYIFAGWNNEGTIAGGSTGDKTFTATWTEVQYTITFNDENGELVENVIYTVNTTSITAPSVPNKTGYSGVWGGYELDETNQIVDPVYTANKYTLSFNVNNGTGTANDITATYDSEIGELPAVERTGYTFEGWYVGETKLSATTVWNYTDDQEAAAEWTAIQYNVVFNANTGSGSMDSQAFTYDEAQALTANEFSKVGYTFTGWNSEANGTGDVNVDNAEVKNLTNVKEDSVTLYAQWTANKYTLSFNVNNGTGTANDITATYDSEIGELPTVERTGYTFAGWYVGETKLHSTTAWNYTAGQTATAQWTANSYSLTFDSMGGSQVTDKTVTFDETHQLTAPTKVGYTFAGWKIGQDELTDTTVWNYTDDKQATAQWTANTYSLTFDSKGGSQAESVVVTYDSEIGKLPIVTRTGYTFDGWKIGSEKIDNTTVWAKAGDDLATAQWTAIQYNVVFNANTGSGSMGNQEFTYDTAQALTSNVFSKVGYAFAGWNSEANGNGTAYANNQKVNNLTDVKENSITLYAQWTANTDTKYLVKHLQQNIENDEYVVVATEQLTATSDSNVEPAVNEYTGFTAPSVKSVTINADGSTVVEYRYSRNSYTLTVDGVSSEYKYQHVIALTIPSKTGFTFKHFALDNSDDTYVASYTMPNGDAELTSVWAINDVTVDVSGYTNDVVYGTEVNLVANVHHDLALTAKYQWYKGDMLLENANSTLKLVNVADSGSYSVIVTITADDQETTATCELTVTIVNANFDNVSAEGYVGTYDGLEHGIVVNAPQGATIHYSLDKNEWSAEQIMFTNIVVNQKVYYKVSLTNYNDFIGDANVIINAKQLTLTLNGQTAIYNGAEPVVDQNAYTLSNGGLCNGEKFDIVITKLAGVDAGKYELAVAHEISNNYAVTVVNDNCYSITAQALTIALRDQQSVYNKVEPTVDSKAYDVTNGVVHGDDYLAIAITKVMGANAGQYELSANWNNDNYSIEFVNAQFTITTQKITVTIKNDSKVYDGKEPTLAQDNYTLDGTVVEGDSLAIVLDKADGVNAGDYLITASWNNNSNYSVTITNGTYTIDKLQITVAISNSQSVYGQPMEMLKSSVKGEVVDGDSAYSLIVADNEGAEVEVATANVGTYRIVGKTTNDNYVVTFECSDASVAYGTYIITKKDVNVSDISFENMENGAIRVDVDGNSHSVTPINVPEGISVVLLCDNADGELFEGATGGTHQIYAQYVADDNHTIVGVDHSSVVLILIKSTIAIEWNYDEKYVYNTQDQSATISASYVDENGNKVSLTVSNGDIDIATFSDDVSVATAFVNAGTYTVTLNIDDEYNIDANSTIVQIIVIEKAKISISGLQFNDREEWYSNTLYTISITGEIPEHTSVAYQYQDGNVFLGESGAGEYSVNAVFSVTDDNYQIEGENILTATLVVKSITHLEQAFMDVIDAITEVTLNSYSALNNALALYNELPYQANVEDYKDLLDDLFAEYQDLLDIETAKEAVFAIQVESISEVTISSYEQLKVAIGQYNELKNKDNVTDAKQSLDNKIMLYNEIVTAKNTSMSNAEETANSFIRSFVSTLTALGAAMLIIMRRK